jgi:hypothetical protein
VLALADVIIVNSLGVVDDCLIALGTLHAVSFCPYSPWREITVQAIGSLSPLTIAVFSWPAAITWHVGEVQFNVSPQPFCA